MKRSHAWVARGVLLLLFIVAAALTGSELFLGSSLTLSVVWATTDF